VENNTEINIEPQQAPITEEVGKKKTSPVLLLVLILGLGAVGAIAIPAIGKFSENKSNTSTAIGAPTEAVSQNGLPVLAVDTNSINTIVYANKLKEDQVLLSAVNDSGNNKSEISVIDKTIKFAVPLTRNKILYIGEVGDTDKGKTIELSEIVPGSATPVTKVLYRASNGYLIDTLNVSENGDWVVWSENKPEGTVDTHEKNYFRSYKASLSGVKNGETSPLTRILLFNEKSDDGITIHLPTLITNTGKVYFNGIKPTEYFLHSGFVDEGKNIILPVNTYNSNPTIGNDKYMLFTSYKADNKPLLPEGNKTSARIEVLNKNSIKVKDLQTNSAPIIVAPGDKGEHYNRPVYVSGDLNGDFTIAAEIFTVANNKLVQKEIQLITRSVSGTVTKKVIADIPEGKTSRILGMTALPDGSQALLVGEESSLLGNLGTGRPIGASGYQKALSAIQVHPVSGSNVGTHDIIPISPDNGEYLGLLPKAANEALGIERNGSLIASIGKNNLQLETFAPVEQKRARTNPRSECITEWESKVYRNYEQCEACPVYVYSEKTQAVTVKPKTPIDIKSAIPAINYDAWDFIADKEGNLLFPDQTLHTRIDFLFPRGKIIAPQSGIIASKEDYSEKIYAYAKSLGFNERESEDAVKFFLPQIEDSNYIYLTHLSKEETKKILDFEVTPKPSVQETRIFYIKKLSEEPSEKPQLPVFSPIKRQGDLTVVTWGGIVE
jgi:hypothetical protein